MTVQELIGRLAMTTLAIDPGTKFCGYAVSWYGILHECGVVETDAQAIYKFVLLNAFNNVIIEKPVIRRNSSKKVRDSDILALTEVVGMWRQAFGTRGLVIEKVEPSVWKGSVEKQVTERRLLVTNKGGPAILSDEEKSVIPDLKGKDREDMLDAVGLLMYKLGRYTR